MLGDTASTPKPPPEGAIVGEGMGGGADGVLAAEAAAAAAAAAWAAPYRWVRPNLSKAAVKKEIKINIDISFLK